MKFYLSIVLCLCFFTINAQDMSWRKHAKLAEQLYKQGEYAEAAQHYESAWQKKTKKKEYIYQAAECYAMIKDYRKAAEAYQYVKEDNKDFQLAGLKYARALKQDGQYDEASRALVYFINSYNESDKAIVEKIAQNEIKGCELGIQMLESAAPSDVVFEHLSNDVNSKQADFAPVPFSDDVLYYSSNMAGETKMYLTQQSGGEWSRARVPKNFPDISAKHFGNGSFSPDNKKFFYTQCDGIDAIGRLVKGCQIYMTIRSDEGWSNPEKLGSGVNKPNSTSTQPFVMHQDGKEMLFFVSDRIGGQGGLDIWYTNREMSGGKFGQPRNLGPTVNSMGDEMTPYFDMDENMLYFSSNGNATIGGFDIFKTSGTNMSDWMTPENIGLPYNSSADDYYFRKSSMGSGYVVSNRVFGLDKTTSMDDDIFSFSAPVEKMMVSGSVINGTNNEPMQSAWVAIYERTADGRTRLLENKEFTEGSYEFGLLPAKDYRIEANAEGFNTAIVDFSATITEEGIMEFEHDITMNTTGSQAIANAEVENNMGTTETMTAGKPNGVYNNPQPMSSSTMTETGTVSTSGTATETMTSPTSTVVTSGSTETTTPSYSEGTQNSNNVVTTPTVSIEDIANGTTTTANGTGYNSSTTSSDYSASPTTPNNSSTTYGEAGVVYKVQLIAVRRFNESHPRYNNARNYGSIETEYFSDKNLTRVLLSGFASKEEAETVRRSMKQQRDFRTAVVVRYENGVRIDPWAK